MCALVTGVQTCALPIFFGAAFFGAAFFTAALAGAAFFAATFLPAAGLALDLLAADFAAGFLAAGFLAALAAFFTVFLTATVLQSFLIPRSEEHTSELQSLMRISYAVFCL